MQKKEHACLCKLWKVIILKKRLYYEFKKNILLFVVIYEFLEI